jgi:hypothetical protein
MGNHRFQLEVGRPPSQRLPFCLNRKKHIVPFTDFIWMCELDEIKGVDIGETYRNEKRVINFAHYIAKTEKQKLVDQINESKYISVICDGCTDTHKDCLFV